LLAYLISGITLGTASGLSPGPLLAFLVSQTLRHGPREGIKVAFAPLLTDAPILVSVLFVLSRISDSRMLLAVIAIAGGLYLVWLGFESIRIRPGDASGGESAPHSLRKAITVNFLNPQVYIFWATVGGPLVVEGSRTGIGAPVAFLGCFYLCICGSKSAIAILLGRSRGILAGSAYRWVVRILGVAIVGFGIWLVVDGVNGIRLVQ